MGVCFNKKKHEEVVKSNQKDKNTPVNSTILNSERRNEQKIPEKKSKEHANEKEIQSAVNKTDDAKLLELARENINEIKEEPISQPITNPPVTNPLQNLNVDAEQKLNETFEILIDKASEVKEFDETEQYEPLFNLV